MARKMYRGKCIFNHSLEKNSEILFGIYNVINIDNCQMKLSVCLFIVSSPPPPEIITLICSNYHCFSLSLSNLCNPW